MIVNIESKQSDDAFQPDPTLAAASTFILGENLVHVPDERILISISGIAAVCFTPINC